MNPSELATVLFALRFLQANYDDSHITESVHFEEEDFNPLSVPEIDALVEKLNTEDAAVAITMDGGLIQHIASSIPLKVTILDFDTDGAEEEDLITVTAQKGEQSKPCYARVDTCSDEEDGWDLDPVWAQQVHEEAREKLAAQQ